MSYLAFSVFAAKNRCSHFLGASGPCSAMSVLTSLSFFFRAINCHSPTAGRLHSAGTPSLRMST